jgi:hypothetical protein
VLETWVVSIGALLFILCTMLLVYLGDEIIMSHHGDQRRHGPGGHRSGTAVLASGNNNAVCYVLPWRPDFVECNYVKEYLDWNEFPGCDYPAYDRIECMAVRLPTDDWAVEIRWTLHEPREVEWHAYHHNDE